jgi:hypothetical protein
VSTNGAGISAENQKVTVSIDNVTVANNGADGIFAVSSATVLLGRSVITGNSTGIENVTSPNAFYTYDDNRIDKNTAANICSTGGCSPLTSLTSQ